jgi:hypothetical protein
VLGILDKHGEGCGVAEASLQAELGTYGHVACIKGKLHQVHHYQVLLAESFISEAFTALSIKKTLERQLT